MKVKVIKNVGGDSLECFGKVGTIHNIKNDSRFTDLTGYTWQSIGNVFETLEGVNQYFSKLTHYETVFVHANDRSTKMDRDKSVGKVKNIIKGYTSKFNIEEVTFFKDEEVLYSGSLDKFLNTSIDDIVLYTKRNEILNSDCYKCLNHNNIKLFLFIN